MINHDVVRLKRSQIEYASEIAAKAFEDDPVFGYLTPNNKRSQILALNWLMRSALEYCYRYGHIYTTPDVKGIAAWLPPKQSAFDGIKLVQLIFQLRLYALPFKCGWDKLGRWLSFLGVMEKYHKQDMQAQSHWYLALMVVNPNYQGQGIGSALLQPILNQTSDEGLACYVVTFTEQAVRFYQKNGFETIPKSQLSENAPPFWTLKRNV